jgi:hypothetical protein
MATLRLISLKCNRQEDSTGDDDTYIEINNGGQFWKGRFDDGQSRTINKDFSFVSRADIRLYEYDQYDPDDFLGSHIVTRDEQGQGEKKVNFSASGASYDLTYIVF